MEMYLNKAAAKEWRLSKISKEKRVSRARQIFRVLFDSLLILVDKKLRSSQVIMLHVTWNQPPQE